MDLVSPRNSALEDLKEPQVRAVREWMNSTLRALGFPLPPKYISNHTAALARNTGFGVTTSDLPNHTSEPTDLSNFRMKP